MAVEGVYSCMKYSLFIFNLLFFIIGGVLLGVGIWVKVDSSSFAELVRVGASETGNPNWEAPAALESAPYILIVMGALIFVIAFLGCCGAIKEWRAMLVLFAILLAIILIILIAAGIVVAVFRDRADKELKPFMNDTLIEWYVGPLSTEPNGFSEAWDLMQTQLDCCGIDNNQGPRDFGFATKWQKGAQADKVPKSCCILKNKDAYLQGGTKAEVQDTNCQVDPTPTNSHIEKGCYSELLTFVRDNATILMGIAIGLGLTLLIGIIIACCLCTAIGKNEMSV